MSYDLGTQDGRKQFVEDNWVEMAHLAWKGFRKAGKRGAVVVDVEAGLGVIDGYALIGSRPDLETDRLHDHQMTYDQKRALVYVFVENGRSIGFDSPPTPKGKKAPPEAFNERVAAQNGCSAESLDILDALESW